MGCGGSKEGGSREDCGKFDAIRNKGWIIDQEAVGEGGFGTVHLCTHASTKKQRACKAMRCVSDLDRQDFKAEVMIMRRVKTHKNVCHIIDYAEDARYGYLVMQSCTGGELFDRIAARNCTERDAAMAVCDVLSALDFLHSKRIIHRDLKPENLLYKDKEAGAPLKLIDFGLAVQLEHGKRETEVCGTTSYMAPEVLKANYDTLADIWSLGVIAYFMLCGKLPFPGRNDDEKEARILRGHASFQDRRWTDGSCSAEAQDFCKKLIRPEEDRRLTAAQALKHPWLVSRYKLSDKPADVNSTVAESLKKYQGGNKFTKAVRHGMATHLTSNELHKLRNAFEALDEGGTGSISLNDLRSLISKQTGQELMNDELAGLDLDGDGQVDWREFVAAVMTDHEVYNEDNLWRVFQQADLNTDGKLSHAEITKMMGDESHEFARELLEAVQQKRGMTSSENIAMTFEEFKEVIRDQHRMKTNKTAKRRNEIHVTMAATAEPSEKV